MPEPRHRKNAAEWIMWIAIAPAVLIARLLSRRSMMIFLALAAPVVLGKEEPVAQIESVHRDQVPHTDRQGHILQKYDPAKSFFPIGLWGQVLPDSPGGPYIAWTDIANAGFNTIWPINWDDKAIPLAEQAGIQLVYMGHIDAAHQKKLVNHPNLLGNMWMDEPTGQLNIPKFDEQALFNDFLAYKKQVNASMPGLPVFVNDPPAIFPNPPKFKEWWMKWNTAGDVACQDDYPLVDRKRRTQSLAEDPTGIPQCVSFAVSINKGAKPEWLIVGAFDSPTDPQWPFRMPTPTQLRAQVYTAIISGATGIQYFIMDSHMSRRGGCVGMSPDPKAAYAPAEAAIATPAELVQSKALWEMARQINSELKELTPSILSPTVGAEVAYKVTVKGDAITKAPLHCLLKPDPQGGYVLLTANVDDAVLDATFEFPAPLKSVEPSFESRGPRTLNTPHKMWVDRYEPFDVHVYRITPAPAATTQPAK